MRHPPRPRASASTSTRPEPSRPQRWLLVGVGASSGSGSGSGFISTNCGHLNQLRPSQRHYVLPSQPDGGRLHDQEHKGVCSMVVTYVDNVLVLSETEPRVRPSRGIAALNLCGACVRTSLTNKACANANLQARAPRSYGAEAGPSPSNRPLSRSQMPFELPCLCRALVAEHPAHWDSFSLARQSGA